MGLGDKLRGAIEKLRSAVFIDKGLIREIIKEIQRTLIAADVEINLVFKLSKEIEEEAMKEPPKGISQREHVIKVIYDKLVELIGGEEKKIDENPERILMIGLFGSGKTTTISKISNYYLKRGKSVGVIAADFTRPAAYEQLEQSCRQINVEVYGKPELSGKATIEQIKKIVKEGLEHFKDRQIILCDSAGRSGLDEELTKEIIGINEAFKPKHAWLVLNADIGQAAKKQAQAFKESVGVDGIIITKMDGSAKGGGALAACHETKAPVLFIGIGEKINDLEEFEAQRYLSRVMGYGDIKGLIERITEVTETEELNPEELMQGEFNLKMFKQQLKATKKMGTFGKIAEMLGLKTSLPQEGLELSEKKMKDFEIIMDSMTKKELEQPDLLNTSRIKRVAKGSGKTEADVRELLKHFKRMQKMFKRFKELGSMNEEELKGMNMEKIMGKMKGLRLGKKQKGFKIK